MEFSATTLNLASMVTHNARLAPQSEAIIWGDVRMTYGQLDAMSNRVAHAIVEMGIGHGDKVALSCPNLPFFPVVYYGIMKAGAAVVPLNVLFKPREVAYHLKDSDAKAVFVFEGTDELPLGQCVKEAFDEADSCEHLVIITKKCLLGTGSEKESSSFPGAQTLGGVIADKPAHFEFYPTSPSDTCAILYTSGTTGQPKGAELTHLNLMTNVTTTYLTHLPMVDFTDGDQ